MPAMPSARSNDAVVATSSGRSGSPAAPSASWYPRSRRLAGSRSACAPTNDDNGTADHDWRIIPDGDVRPRNPNWGKVLAVENMSTANSARVQQFSDNGTEDHLWTFVPDANGYFRVRNAHSQKVLAVSGASTADSAQVTQYDDNGAADHRWRFLLISGTPASFRLQNQNSGKILAVHNA